MKRMLVALMIVSAMACAHPRHTAVVVDVALYETLSDTHALEQKALCGVASCAGVPSKPIAGWSDEKSKAFNQKLLPAVAGGREFNRILSEWKSGTPAPAQLHDVVTSIGAAIGAVTLDFPDGTTKNAILANLTRAQSLVLQALDLILSLKGGA